MMANEKRLIDANALIRNYEAHRNLYLDAWGSFSQMPTIDKVSVDTIDTCISDVINAPTVEVVHGRWMFDSDTERCFCSACNEEALYTSKDDPIFDYDWEENLRYSHTETILEEHLTNYCPNCGAKMDGDGNE